MNPKALGALLADVAAGHVTVQDALERLRYFPSEQLPFATIDHHRALRQGRPEVVFCESKTVEQVVGICERLAAASGSFLATRVTGPQIEALRHRYPMLQWNETGRVAHYSSGEIEPRGGLIAVVCAGTSDLPVGEEAAAGANGDTREATSGTITFTQGDGPATITIAGVTVTGVGQVSDTGEGLL